MSLAEALLQSMSTEATTAKTTKIRQATKGIYRSTATERARRYGATDLRCTATEHAIQFVTQPACHTALMLSLFRRPFGIATEHASFSANMSALR